MRVIFLKSNSFSHKKKENDNFQYWQEFKMKTKFCGNYLTAESTGQCHVFLKKTGDYFISFFF